jgi:hypothetical protein
MPGRGRLDVHPGQPVWTAGHTEELYREFVLRPLVGGGSFLGKLSQQLRGSPAVAIQLAAELMYLHLVPAAGSGRGHQRRRGRGARRSQAGRRHAGAAGPGRRPALGDAPPGEDTKRRGDEARQLAWRLWTTRAPYLWLVGPGVRHAYRCRYDPLALQPIPSLPAADKLRLASAPTAALGPPPLLA